MVQCYAGLARCDVGYYDYDGGRCVTREECNSMRNYYVLETQGICVKVSQLSVSESRLVENPVGTYICRENGYLVYASLQDADGRGVSCVNFVEECAEFYVVEGLQMCVDREWCLDVYGGVIYAHENVRKCVTYFECVSTYRRYVNGSECVGERPNDSSGTNGFRHDNNSYSSALSTPSENPVLKTSKPCGDDYQD